MSTYGELKRRIRNADRTELYRFLVIWAVAFVTFWGIDIRTGGGVPVMFLIVAPFFTAVTSMFLINKAGGFFSRTFYAGKRSDWTPKERFAGDLSKVRTSKSEGRFSEALALVNDYLKKLPDDPEALLLKAQILHEGFGYNESSAKCLESILKKVSPSEYLHSWASNYYESLMSEIKKK